MSVQYCYTVDGWVGVYGRWGFDRMKYGGVHDCLFAILLYPDLLIGIRWSIHVKFSQMSDYESPHNRLGRSRQ